jgi:hypothetical protein
MRYSAESGVVTFEASLIVAVFLPLLLSGVAIGIWEYNRHVISTSLDAIELRKSPSLASFVTDDASGTRLVWDLGKVRSFLEDTNHYAQESMVQRLVGLRSDPVSIQTSIAPGPNEPPLETRQLGASLPDCYNMAVLDGRLSGPQEQGLITLNVTVWVKLAPLDTISILGVLPSCIRLTKAGWLRKQGGIL